MRYITQRKPSAQTGRGEGAVLLYRLKALFHCASAELAAHAGAPRGADNLALGAMLLHAQAAPTSASPSYLKSHFTTDILQYIAQPGHMTSGAARAAAARKPRSLTGWT